jgi:hypothetical protein
MSAATSWEHFFATVFSVSFDSTRIGCTSHGHNQREFRVRFGECHSHSTAYPREHAYATRDFGSERNADGSLADSESDRNADHDGQSKSDAEPDAEPNSNCTPGNCDLVDRRRQRRGRFRFWRSVQRKLVLHR